MYLSFVAEDSYTAANLDRIRFGRGVLQFLFKMFQGKGDEAALVEIISAGLASTVPHAQVFDCSIWGGSLSGIQLIWHSAKVFGMLCLHLDEDGYFVESMDALSSLIELFSVVRRFESGSLIDPDWVREVSLFVRAVLSWVPFAIVHLLSKVDEMNATNKRLRTFAAQFKDLLGITTAFSLDCSTLNLMQCLSPLP